MKSAHLRITITWLCFSTIIASLFLVFSPLILCASCAVIIVATRWFLVAAMPLARERAELLVFVAALPIIGNILAGWWETGFADDWAWISKIEVWIVLPTWMVLTFYEDSGLWRSDGTGKSA